MDNTLITISLTQEQIEAFKPLIDKLIEAREKGPTGMVLSQPWFNGYDDHLIFYFIEPEMTDKILDVTYQGKYRDPERMSDGP